MTINNYGPTPKYKPETLVRIIGFNFSWHNVKLGSDDPYDYDTYFLNKIGTIVERTGFYSGPLAGNPHGRIDKVTVTVPEVEYGEVYYIEVYDDMLNNNRRLQLWDCCFEVVFKI